MSKSTLELRGRVVQTGTDRGIPDLRIVIVDQEQTPTMMFRAITDEDGGYCIELSKEEAASLFSLSQGQVWDAVTRFYISVYNGDALLLTTNDTLQMQDVARGVFPVVLEVNVSGTADIEFSVHGRVVQADGSPVGGARLRVERVEAGARTVVAAGNAETDGTFDLTYAGVDASTVTATNTAIVVVVDDGASGEEIVRTPVIVDPDPRHLVDLLTAELTDYTGQPEYARVLAAFEPWVSPNALPNLSSDDLELLVKRSGMPAEQVAMAIQAQRIATARGIPAEASYALMRAGMPADVPGQLAQSRERIRGALQAAIDGNLVSDTLADGNPFDVETLVGTYTTSKVDAVLTGTDDTLNRIVQSSALPTTQTNLFVTRMAEHEGSRDELWTALRAGTDFSNAEVDALEFTLGVSALSNGSYDIVAALQTERTGGSISTVSDLTAWDETDWGSFVATHGAPTDLPGTQAERETLYAAAINRYVEEKFPTGTVARRLERDDPASEIPAFLDARADFDIESTVIAQYADANPTAFDGYATDVQAAVKSVQRVYALTPRFHRYAVARALLDAGIDSAAQVVHQGKAGFIATYTPILDGLHDNMSGEEAAKAVYRAALQKHAFSAATMAQYGASFNHVQVPSIPSKSLSPEAGDGAATLANLFGSLDYCACEHCRSMYGPAAYLVALLSSLEGATFLDELTSRRGDMTALELSCINTNTPLPYIDVVNEVLEQVSLELQVEGDLDGLELEARQTTWTAEELRINPEPTGFSAPDGSGGTISPYDGPAQAVFPWSLPLDLPAVETRAYLDQLGVPRAELMRLFGATDEHAERLGMTAREFSLTAGTAVDASPQVAWGMAGDADWVNTLANNLATLLDRSGMTYEELTKVLALRYVNDDVSPATIRFTAPEGEPEPSCALEDRLIEPFSEGIADRMHRFLRLSRKLNLDWLELDRLIATVGNGAIDTAFLETLADLLELAERFGLDTDEVAAFDSNIGAYPYDEPFEPSPSLYERLFQSRKVFPEPDPAFAIGALSDTILPEHSPTLRAALGINDAELSVLLAEEGTERTLENLSQMFRVVRLSKSLGLSVADFYRAVALSEIAPFATSSNTLAFVDLVNSLVDWGVPFVDLNYLCRHDGVEEYGQELSLEDRNGIVEALAPAFEAVELALALDGDPLAVMRDLAMRAQGDARADELVGILVNAPAVYGFEDDVGVEEPVVWSFFPAEVESFPDHDWLGEDPNTSIIDARSSWMAEQIREQLRQEGRASAVIDLLSEVVGLERELVETLATDYVSVDVAGAPMDLVTLLRLDAVDNDAATDDAELRDEGLVRFLKTAVFISSLRVEADELDWYFAAPVGAQGMDLGSVPLEPGTNVFQGWNTVRRGLVNAEAFADESPLPELAGMTAAEQAAGIAAATGWNVEDVQSAIAELPGLALEDPAVLEFVRRVVTATRAAGVDAATLGVWATTAPSVEGPPAMREAMRARFSESQWPKVIQPISDQLRELRRDALLAYILMNSDFENEADVYDHFLLDPEMNACMLTSRVKLAISAVQLFIQRALLGIEENVTLPAGFEKDWEWKKNYRVWEANRKVFFYPENWIEPELRVGKTPFFEELEAHLQQGELTEAHVERGFDDYISKLHEVSNLEVLDVHRTGTELLGSVVHVVARTRSAPHRYFHRTHVNDSYWTPWREVEAAVDSRRVVLRSVRGRLFLFWLGFEEVVSEESSDESETVRTLQYKLSWAEHREGAWERTRTSESVAPSSPVPLQGGAAARSEEKRRHHLWGSIESGGGLVVTVYKDVSPILEFRYDACSDVFRGGDPRTPQYLMSDRWTRAYPLNNVGKGGGVEVLRGSGGEIDIRDNFLLVENVGQKTHFSYARQDGVYTADPRPDAVHPGILSTRKHNLYAFPITGTVVATDDGPGPAGDAVPFAPYLYGDTSLAVEQPLVELEDWGGVSATELQTAQFDQSILHGASIATSLTQETFVPGQDHQWKPAWRLDLFHHPYTCPMLNALRERGVDGLLNPEPGKIWRQLDSTVHFLPLEESSPGDENRLTEFVVGPYPRDEFDFSGHGAYSVYNWEVFYHVPMLIADRYRRDGNHEEADRWYRYIFDPRAGDVVDPDGDVVEGPERFWRTKRLYLETRDGDVDVIQAIFSNEGLDAHPDVVSDFLKGIVRWVMSPFDPHAIAAVRSGTYRWVAVRKYLDNLIDWGDSLFHRDTIESIGEATQLYLLASAVLGQRPERLSQVDLVPSTYSDLGLAGLFGGLAELEGFHPSNGGGMLVEMAPGNDAAEPPPIWWYFCLPTNPQLLEFWDTVEDRIFKIRNCQNIEGVERQLALFQPPIDPALLVRARAAGLDLGEVAGGLGAPMPLYRYRTSVARSVDLANDVRSLGSALLVALEKRDGEELARVRSRHEVTLRERILNVRRVQVEEARSHVDTLHASREIVRRKSIFYGTREKVSRSEQKQVDYVRKAGRTRMVQQGSQMLASVLSLIPNIHAGTGFFANFGGTHIGAGMRAVADGAGAVATHFEMEGTLAGMGASQDRRWDDWQLQLQLAQAEGAHIDKQIIAAEIRKAISEKELENQERQIEQSKEVHAFYEDKFTNKELYDWTVGEVSRLYFQAYKLAFDMAKKAERAMQFELETEDTFIEFGYWDGLKKGLMAGERLHLDIKRMESAYLEKDKRELELTKRVSLRQIAPGALAQLREFGECEFEIPELLFDLDHAGHYLRRMRAVRVTMPAVAGPQTSMGATLTLLRDDLRTDASLEETAVRTTYGGTKRIATSHAREDGGLFELNFRDERYLPFEGAGVASRWGLRLPTAVRQFDYDTITDVEIRIDYTARDGGSSFRGEVESGLQEALDSALAVASENGIAMVLSAKKDFAVDWERFLRPADGQLSSVMEVPITLDRFPYLLRRGELEVQSVDAILVGERFTLPGAAAVLTLPGGGTELMSDDMERTFSADVVQEVDHRPWGLDLGSAVGLGPDHEVEDLWVIVRFNATGISSS